MVFVMFCGKMAKDLAISVCAIAYQNANVILRDPDPPKWNLTKYI